MVNKPYTIKYSEGVAINVMELRNIKLAYFQYCKVLMLYEKRLEGTY